MLSLLCCLGCLRKLFCFGLNLLVSLVWDLVGFGAVACLDTLWLFCGWWVLMAVGVWCVVCCGLADGCEVGCYVGVLIVLV